MEHNSDWKEAVFLAVIKKETRPESFPRSDEFEESFDYALANFLNEDERNGLMRFWRDKEIAQLTAQMAEKASSPAELDPILKKIRAITRAQERAVKALRAQKPFAILTRGLSVVTGEEELAITKMQEKVRQLIYADKKTFAASNLNWHAHVSERDRGNWYYWGSRRPQYSVDGLTILDIYDYVNTGKNDKMSYKQKNEIPPVAALRAALDDYLKDPAVRAFSNAHLSAWNEAVKKAFDELRYYRSGAYLNELKEKNWKAALCLAIMDNTLLPEGKVQEDGADAIIKAVLHNANLSRLESHILLSNFRDQMSIETLADELQLTIRRTEGLLEKAMGALTAYADFLRDWNHLSHEDLMEKAEVNEQYKNILAEITRDSTPAEDRLASDIYAWAFMRERTDVSVPVPLDFDDSCKYILRDLSKCESKFVEAFFKEEKSLPQIAAILQQPLSEIIQVRVSLMQKIRQPENHALLIYGKTYMDSLSERERNDLIAGFIPIENLRPITGFKVFFSLRYTDGIQTVKEFFDKEMASINHFMALESPSMKHLERFLGAPSFEQVEVESAKYAYRMRMQRAFSEKYQAMRNSEMDVLS